MTRAGRIGWWSAACLALGLGAVASPAVAATPQGRLSRTPKIYATPGAGGGTADARRRLELAVGELAAQGRPVKLAVVPGPAGTSWMLLYARRLARAAGITDTLVVSAPGAASRRWAR